MRLLNLFPGLLFILIFVFPNALFAQKNTDQNQKGLVVLVKYKSQPGKDSLAIVNLKTLLSKVKNEPHYLNIVIHVDPVDKNNILLYEEWNDEEYYKGEHMRTPHLQQFMKDAMSFIAGPPEITFWKIKN